MEGLAVDPLPVGLIRAGDACVVTVGALVGLSVDHSGNEDTKARESEAEPDLLERRELFREADDVFGGIGRVGDENHERRVGDVLKVTERDHVKSLRLKSVEDVPADLVDFEILVLCDEGGRRFSVEA